MAGSWEVDNANQVIVGILHTETVPIAWAFGLKNLKIPGDPSLRRFDPFLPICGRPFDHGRNDICMAALQVGARYVYMLDSDVVPPNDAILRLIKHDLPIVSGMYCRRSPPHAVPVMIKNGGWYIPPRPNMMVEVDLVGAGCFLIKTDVLKKLHSTPVKPGRPYFAWQVDLKGHVPEGEALSEDFVFCQHARKHGYKIMVDTSIQCKHIGLAQAGLQTYLPCDVSVQT